MILQHFFAMIHEVLKAKQAERGWVDPPLWFFQKYVFQRKGEALAFCDF